ncbi:MAG TPA: hypothetical protein VF789_04175 [Thermoanaerobaculia bacterium]
MSQRKLYRIAAASFLVALLTLPGAASARTAHRGATSSLFEWIGGLWEKGRSLLVVIGDRPKAGAGIDPNGKPTPPGEAAPSNDNGSSLLSTPGEGNG